MGVKSPQVELNKKQINNRFRRIELLIETLQKKEGTLSVKTEKNQTQDEFVESILEGGVEQVETQAALVMNDDGEMELYDTREGERVDVVLPDTAKIGSTIVGQTVPSGYFMNLRLHNNSTIEKHITADYLVVHDSSTPWNTIGLSSVDVTNNITAIGPIANGRDQAEPFDEGWIYFYVIYKYNNGSTISSLSSESATAPTLPAGYTYFVRVGASKL